MRAGRAVSKIDTAAFFFPIPVTGGIGTFAAADFPAFLFLDFGFFGAGLGFFLVPAVGGERRFFDRFLGIFHGACFPAAGNGSSATRRQLVNGREI